MAKAQKFGTFGGVFVPSVLTILGVIMYLRLGWVVGNAGLVGTIVIILIAHVISVTTGLSVSSIATDKKVKAGKGPLPPGTKIEKFMSHLLEFDQWVKKATVPP